MLICYPNQSIVLGKVNHCFGVMPGRKKPKNYYLTPAMYGGPHKPPARGYCTSHTTTSQDGAAVMDNPGLVNFHGRGLLCWSHWTMAFLPPELGIEIDAEKFLSAFTYRDAAGEQVSLREWDMAPSASVNQPYEDKHLNAQADMLDVLYNRTAKGIPGLSEHSFDLGYLTERNNKIRPDSKYMFK